MYVAVVETADLGAQTGNASEDSETLVLAKPRCIRMGSVSSDFRRYRLTEMRILPGNTGRSVTFPAKRHRP